jgi:hypothetical protein
LAAIRLSGLVSVYSFCCQKSGPPPAERDLRCAIPGHNIPVSHIISCLNKYEIFVIISFTHEAGVCVAPGFFAAAFEIEVVRNGKK